MRETVLLFNIKDKKRAQELQMICMSLRIRVADKKRRVFSDGWCTCRNERNIRDRQDL